MEQRFSYQTSCVNEYNYDIFEIGSDVVAYNVKWEYVEKLVTFFNDLEH